MTPLASPLLADDLGGLPSGLVVTAEHDPLRAEGERYAHRLRSAGTPVELVRFDDVPHGFFSLAGEVDAADRAQTMVIEALKDGVRAAADDDRPSESEAAPASFCRFRAMYRPQPRIG